MPIHRTIEEGLVRTAVTGYVTLDEIWQHISQSRVSGEFQLPELVDARGAAPVSLSVNDLQKIAALVKASLGDRTPGPRAIVVNTDENRRLARAFVTFASAWIPLAIFDDPAHAVNWLRNRPPTGVRSSGPASPEPQEYP